MMSTSTSLTRDKAIQCLDSLFERAFGSDKGSSQAYEEWCEEMGLCEWDEEVDEYVGGREPPGQHQILSAVGISPQELVDVLGINPKSVGL